MFYPKENTKWLENMFLLISLYRIIIKNVNIILHLAFQVLMLKLVFLLVVLLEALLAQISECETSLSPEHNFNSERTTISDKARTQEELQYKLDRLVNTGRKYGIEINIDKSQVMRVSSIAY